MALNNLLASPGFAAWMEGEPLDIRRLLFTAEGKPRVSIFSIAHLSDAERMFFVTLLLNQVLGWMRKQPGTTSLRAIVYMDEIFGYFPPVANPPSKAAAAHAAEAGARVRRRRRARDAEPGRSRLQRRCRMPARGSSAGCRRSAIKAAPRSTVSKSVAASAGGAFDREATSAGSPASPSAVPDAQRPRGSARRLRKPLGDVVPAWAADARTDQDAHGGEEGARGWSAAGAKGATGAAGAPARDVRGGGASAPPISTPAVSAQWVLPPGIPQCTLRRRPPVVATSQ